MRITLLFVVIPAAFVACATPAKSPRNSVDAAKSQATLSMSPSQKELWEQLASSKAVNGLDLAYTDGPVVRKRTPLRIPNKQVVSSPQSFPDTVKSALVIRAMPIQEDEFTGTARIHSIEGEFIALDVGQERILRLQAKARGGPLRAKPGEPVQLLLRRGSPFERKDILAIHLEHDDLIHALVGGHQPVRLSIPSYSLTASQIGTSERNTMSVKLIVGDETHTVRHGEEVIFKSNGLTVKVVSSIAVQGESANVLPEAYRLEILGWRTNTNSDVEVGK